MRSATHTPSREPVSLPDVDVDTGGGLTTSFDVSPEHEKSEISMANPMVALIRCIAFPSFVLTSYWTATTSPPYLLGHLYSSFQS